MKKHFATLFGARQEIENKLADYLKLTEEMALVKRRGVEALHKQDLDGFSRIFERINEAEHRLDTLRLDVEEEIYRRRRLPDTGGDLLGLPKCVDKIPNRIEALTGELALAPAPYSFEFSKTSRSAG